MNGSLRKGKHRYILIILIVPCILLSYLKKPPNQIHPVLQLCSFLLKVVTSISRVKTGNVILPVDLITVQDDDHSFLNWSLILVQEKKEVYLVVSDRVAEGGYELVLGLELLSFVFYLSDYADHVDLALWVLL